MTWTSLSWLLPLAFLVLPGCELFFTLDNPSPQPPPEDFAVFCDVVDRKIQRRCATAEDLMGGVAISSAAVALTTRTDRKIGLDHSPAASQALGCAPGTPVAVSYQDAFPKGSAVCVSGPTWAEHAWHDFDEVCQSACIERLSSELGWLAATAFCVENARASTNFPPGEEFQSYFQACTAGGMENPQFDTEAAPDPRRRLEPAPWEYISAGVARSGPHDNTLTRTAPTTGVWDQGAATLHLISEGDGYVEFTVNEKNGHERACGLSTGVAPDTDHGLNGIEYAVRLDDLDGLMVHQSGFNVTPFFPFAAGDRVRVAFADNFDGTADITFRLIPASCQGPACDGNVLHTAGPAAYPLRVDAALHTQGAVLSDVRMVRVRKPLW